LTGPIKMGRSFVTVGGWTMISRVAGFAREIIIAAFFGSGPIAEAFQVAFALPNMFRRFFAEGAFNMAFVPMFSKRYQSGDQPEKFAQDALAFLASILIGFTLIAQFAMPWLVLAMASGFDSDDRFDLAVVFGRICFPYILFISIAALFSGVLNAMGRFTAAAAAPVFLNFILVSFMVGAYWLGRDVGLALSWGVPVAGIVQMALVWVAANRAGIRLVPRLPKSHRKSAVFWLLPPLRHSPGVWCRSTFWSDGRYRVISMVQSSGWPWLTGCINCHWVWLVLLSGWFCCPTCRAAYRQRTLTAGKMLSTVPPNSRWP
jgi:putative peptidoglycan lipid II flippase